MTEEDEIQIALGTMYMFNVSLRYAAIRLPSDPFNSLYPTIIYKKTVAAVDSKSAYRRVAIHVRDGHGLVNISNVVVIHAGTGMRTRFLSGPFKQ